MLICLGNVLRQLLELNLLHEIVDPNKCKNFVYSEAIVQHCGVRADELSFAKGDLIWVIDRRHSPEGRWKGVVFGQKGNSRSGHFPSSAVIITGNRNKQIFSRLLQVRFVSSASSGISLLIRGHRCRTIAIQRIVATSFVLIFQGSIH
ncbi:CASK interacting protein 1 [Parelaphostrongylus tenuis]|uniref:CASK interacting protein 1 n=1 Tax=Parelaphostrongylus tenuis TaxID=148309 RepID=A0AAD5WHN6_PARTN|nr:CASK interacting protein 1 [Parelaphostrongylus tenuis]